MRLTSLGHPPPNPPPSQWRTPSAGNTREPLMSGGSLMMEVRLPGCLDVYLSGCRAVCMSGC